MDDIRVERIRLEDGRHAERRVRETEDERVVELRCEPERTLHLKQRVVERKKPVVYERTIETITNDEVVERKTESLEPGVKMELREHVAKSHAKCEHHEDVPDAQAVVTRSELKDAILAAVKAVKTDEPVPTPRAVQPRAEQEVAQRVEAAEKPSWKTIGLWALILVEAAGLAYIIFWM